MSELTSAVYNVFQNPDLTGRIGISIGIAAVLGVVTLALLYSGLPFFGPVNDLTNAVMGVLSALLAWQLFPVLRSGAQGTAAAFLASAWLGTLAIAGNSIMVAFGRLDWKTGGMYTAFGLAFQGIWLIGLSYAAAEQGFPGEGLVKFARVTGIAMLAGFAAGPLLAYGERFFGNPLVWVAFAGAAIGWVLYPVWCWMLGRQLMLL